MTVFISNGQRVLEVTHLDAESDRMAVLEWFTEEYGVLSPMRITEANEQGFVPVETP